MICSVLLEVLNAENMEEACLRAPAVVKAITDFDMPDQVVHVSLQAPAAFQVDLSDQNQELLSVDPSDCAASCSAAPAAILWRDSWHRGLR